MHRDNSETPPICTMAAGDAVKEGSDAQSRLCLCHCHHRCPHCGRHHCSQCNHATCDAVALAADPVPKEAPALQSIAVCCRGCGRLISGVCCGCKDVCVGRAGELSESCEQCKGERHCSECCYDCCCGCCFQSCCHDCCGGWFCGGCCDKCCHGFCYHGCGGYCGLLGCMEKSESVRMAHETCDRRCCPCCWSELTAWGLILIVLGVLLFGGITTLSIVYRVPWVMPIATLMGIGSIGAGIICLKRRYC